MDIFLQLKKKMYIVEACFQNVHTINLETEL